MKEELIKFKTAKLAKEKGFKVECSDYYDVKGNTNSFEHYGEALPYGVCFKPTQSLLQKWLREVHKINVYCTPTHYNYDVWVNNVIAEIPVPLLMGSYEEVLEKGLQEGLKLINK
jgi:hypothetical protein